MKNRVIIVLVFIAFILLGVYFAVYIQGQRMGQNNGLPVVTESPTPNSAVQNESTPTVNLTSSPDSQNAKQQVKIYLVALEDEGKSGREIGCGDSIVPVTRNIEPTQAVLTAALNELLSLKQQYYGESGLYNALYRSNLKTEKATVENGTAKVYLTGTLSLGGVCDNPRVKEQIRETALQFPTVNKVDIFINNRPIDEVLSLK